MKKAVIFSALGPGSGCLLRAKYLSESLSRQGWESRLVSPWLSNRAFALESLASIPRFILIALVSGADLAVAIKPYPNCWMALWILRLKGAKVVMDVDDLDASWRGGALGALSAAIQAPAFRLLDSFSTHHPLIRESLAAHGRVLDLGQGVDTRVFFPRRQKKEKLLLYTAHLNVASQLEPLMGWVAPWLARHPEWSLVVAGGGPRLEAYRRAFEGPQVLFTGALAPREVADWIGSAACCLSAYDGGPGNLARVPMKVGEYLAMAKPVVSNLIDGLKPLGAWIYACKPDAASYGRQLDRVCLRGGDGREKRGAAWVARELSSDAVTARFLGQVA